MSKNANRLPAPSYTQWSSLEGIDWAYWETQVADEMRIEMFEFSEADKIKIVSEIERLGRSKGVKIEDSKNILRALAYNISIYGLPDHHIFCSDCETKPSSFLLELWRDEISNTLSNALKTIDDREGRTLSISEGLTKISEILAKRKRNINNKFIYSVFCRLVETLEAKEIPDTRLRRRETVSEPSDEFVELGVGVLTGLFSLAMVHSSSLQQRQNAVDRIRNFIKILRENPKEIVIELPRQEAIAVHEIREIFFGYGISTKVTHTHDPNAGEGNEKTSTFQRFVFQFVLPDIGSDPAARKILQRRLDEAKRSVRL